MSKNAKAQKIVTPGATSTTLTAANSDQVMLLDGATEAYVLPAISNLEIGTTFTFLVTSAATTQTITAQSGDLLTGAVALLDDTAAYTAPQGVVKKPDVSDDLIITLNGTTTGGKVGSTLKLTAVSATRWFVEGTLCGSGVLATPFS